jgi:hypothetical protein
MSVTKDDPDIRWRRSEMDLLVFALLDNQMRMIIGMNTPPDGSDPSPEQQEQINMAIVTLQRIKATVEGGGVVEDQVDPVDVAIRATRSGPPPPQKSEIDSILAAVAAEIKETLTTEDGARIIVDSGRGGCYYAPTVTGKVLRFKATRIVSPSEIYGLELDASGNVDNFEEVLLPDELFFDYANACERAEDMAKWRASVLKPGDEGYAD